MCTQYTSINTLPGVSVNHCNISVRVVHIVVFNVKADHTMRFLFPAVIYNYPIFYFMIKCNTNIIILEAF